jgi:hypothetical protein
MAWVGSRLLIWGGSAYRLDGSGFATYTNLADGAFYDPATDRWTPTAPMPAGTPKYLSSDWSDGRVVVQGQDASTTVLLIYDPTRDQWQSASPAPSVPASYPTILNAAANTWLAFPPRSMPPDERFEVFTGKLLIEWGGSRPGPTPPKPCLTNPYPGCDPPSSLPIPTNEGEIATALP